jgi:hypothetical protein
MGHISFIAGLMAAGRTIRSMKARSELGTLTA